LNIDLIILFSSWCKILRVQKLQQILVVVLNGVTNENYNQLKDTEHFQGWTQLFTSVRENQMRQISFLNQIEINEKNFKLKLFI